MLSPVLRKAIEFSALKLKTVFRKRSGLPYFTHIARVLCILIGHGLNDKKILSASALHDTIEEGGSSAEELSNLFHDSIVQIVLELTDSTISDPAVLKQHKIFLAKYVYSHEAVLISCADKYDNFFDNLEEYKLGLTKFTSSKIDYYFGLFKSFEFRYEKHPDPILRKMLNDYRLLLNRYENEIK